MRDYQAELSRKSEGRIMTTGLAPGPPRRGHNLSPAQRAILDAILRDDPSLSNLATRATFLARGGGGDATDRTIRVARSRLGLARPPCRPRPVLPAPTPPPPPPPPECYADLPRDQAAALAWIADHRPDLTPIGCVALMATMLEADP